MDVNLNAKLAMVKEKINARNVKVVILNVTLVKDQELARVSAHFVMVRV
jgi:hypothetical protein